MEAEAARAAALLVSDDASASAGIEYDGHDAIPPMDGSADDNPGVPATWRLPAALGAAGAAPEGLTPGAAARAVAGYAAVTAGASPVTASTVATAVAGVAAGVTATIAGAAAGGGAPSDAVTTSETSPGWALEPETFVLPDPATMPAITPEQRERLEALSSRIESLKTELASAIAEAEEVLTRTPPRHTPAEPRPEFVDRRL